MEHDLVKRQNAHEDDEQESAGESMEESVEETEEYKTPRKCETSAAGRRSPQNEEESAS